MTNICTFYNTSRGCERSNRCGFFHLTEDAFKRVASAKRINTHAYSKICKTSVLVGCKNPKCEYLHPEDDVRYSNSIIYKRKVFDENCYLNRQIEIMDEKAKKDERYINTLKKESEEYINNISYLHKQNERLLYTTQKTGSNNRYLRGKIIRMKEEQKNNSENISGQKTIIIRRHLNTKEDVNSKEEDDRKEDTDPFESNADFIHLMLPRDAVSPPPLRQQENPRPHKKRRRYFDQVDILPRTTRNGKGF